MSITITEDDKAKILKKVKCFTTIEPGFEPEDKYNQLTFEKLDDGAISIIDNHVENHIYLYPDQVRILKVFLKD